MLATVAGVAARAQAGFFADAGSAEFSGLSSARQPRENAPPDAATTLRVFGVVEAYVRGTGGIEAVKQVTPVHGCAVVVRLAGEVIGRGSSVGLPGSAASADHAAAAVEAAWKEAERRMPIGGTPEKRAAMVEVLRKDLLISLELSGPMIRIAANAYGDFDLTLQPGMDGLAAAMEGKVGAVFPSAGLEGNVMPGDSARRAVGEVAKLVRGEGASIVSLTEPAELEKKHAVTLYRFRTSHVAQWRADKGPELLYRGQKLVLQQDVDEVGELWHIADRLAGNLANRLAVKPPAGVVTLPTGSSEEPDAQGCALARHALLEYYSRRWERWNNEEAGKVDVLAMRESLDRTREAAVEYLRLARAGASRLDEKGLLATNALITPHADSKNSPEEKALEQEFQDGLVRAAVPAGLKGLTVWGNGSWPKEVSGDTSKYHPMERSVRAVMAGTPVAALPGEMPWLGWIDLAVDRHLKRPVGGKSASALREMRTLVWKHQLKAVDAGPDRQDMVGGIAVPGSPNPLPTWQTARMVAFLGTMLGEPELTPPAERGGEIVKLLGAARYLRQLQVDDTMGWLSKEPTVVKGGVRNATWDQRTQTGATAMSLLAVLEIVGGVEKAGAGANGQSAK